MTALVVSSDYNVNNPKDFFGDHPIRTDISSNGFHVYDAGTGNNIYISGSGIQYNASGQGVAGTVNSIVCVTGNGQETLFNLSGANIDIAYANSQDWSSAQELNYWLGPNPTVSTVPGGLAGQQTISAPSGVNEVYGYTGHNTVVYSAPSTNFTLEVNSILSPSNGTVTVYQGDPLSPITANTQHAIQDIQFADQTLKTEWFTKASLLHDVNPSEFSVLSELYLAYFNRAPDAVGLDYWASNAYDYIAGGMSEPAANKAIANNFALSPESKAIYGTVNQNSSVADLTNFVTKVYQNVLNRGPDSDGLNYWVNNLQTGKSTPGGFITDVVYAVNSQSGTTDKIYLSNKAAVGEHFGVEVGLTNSVQAQNVMAVYNATYNSSGPAAAVHAANAMTDSYASEVSLIGQPELIVHLLGTNL